MTFVLGNRLPVYIRPPRCLGTDGVARELIYRLDPDRSYPLEISAATDPALSFMVTAEPAP